MAETLRERARLAYEAAKQARADAEAARLQRDREAARRDAVTHIQNWTREWGIGAMAAADLVQLDATTPGTHRSEYGWRIEDIVISPQGHSGMGDPGLHISVACADCGELQMRLDHAPITQLDQLHGVLQRFSPRCHKCQGQAEYETLRGEQEARRQGAS